MVPVLLPSVRIARADVRLELADVHPVCIAPHFCDMVRCTCLRQKAPQRICICHHPGTSPVPGTPPLSPLSSQQAACFPGTWHLACVCWSFKGPGDCGRGSTPAHTTCTSCPPTHTARLALSGSGAYLGPRHLSWGFPPKTLSPLHFLSQPPVLAQAVKTQRQGCLGDSVG